ncbi:cytochrome P450 [Ascobolus immersus RN42]|uniref:Cytochrome P450 n=1 Tax=Ascobolus immersus RN42 TaxID=1160509 RepID=A0A3N4HB74_ASCIM|nr:cytochrome P450 [Ascobolus immersus RN42]
MGLLKFLTDDARGSLSPLHLLRSSKLLLTVLASIFILYRISVIIYRIFFHPLRHFPGPILAKVTTAYQVYYEIVKDGNLSTHCHHVLHEKYGPVVRIGPNRLRIQSVEAFHQMTRIGTPFTRDSSTYIMFGFENMMADPSNERHRERRSIFQNAFRRSEILKAEPLVTRRMKRFMRKLDEMCKESGGQKELNVLWALNCQGLEIFTEFAFAQDSRYIDTPEFADRFAVGLRDVLDATVWTKAFPGIFLTFRDQVPVWLRSILFPRSGILNSMLEYSHYAVDSRRANFYQDSKADNTAGDKGQNDFRPHTFLDKIFSEHPENHTFPPEFYRDVAQAFAASFGTVAYTTFSGLYYLQKYPEVRERVLRELMTIVPAGKRGEFIDHNTIQEKLPYFCAVVKEVIRLSLTIAGAFPRITPPEGATLLLPSGPVHVPGGSAVEVTVYSAHMDPVAFPEPSKFDPERWMDKREAMRLEKHIILFGAGSTICLGMHMGLMQLHMNLANLIRSYEIELGDELKERGLVWVEKWAAVERVESLMKFKVRRE